MPVWRIDFLDEDKKGINRIMIFIFLRKKGLSEINDFCLLLAV
jgi:hypothetical protein